MEFKHLTIIKINGLVAGKFSIKECQKAVEDALSVGYRLLILLVFIENEEAVGHIKASGSSLKGRIFS